MSTSKRTAEQRIATLDRMLDAQGDGTTHGANVIARELVEMQFAILSKQIPLTLDDLRARVRRADEFIPNLVASLPR